MTTKTAFTADEWKTLLQAPFVVGMYITLASPSLTDALKESMAVAKQIAKTAQSTSGSELLRALVDEYKDSATAQMAQPDLSARDIEAVKTKSLADVKSAATLLHTKATAAEASEITKWIYDIGVAAAEAAKEGDFLGIGGVRVSDEEKAALAQLASALGVSV